MISEYVGTCAACAILWCSVGRKGEAELAPDADVKNPRGKAIGWYAATHCNEGLGRVWDERMLGSRWRC